LLREIEFTCAGVRWIYAQSVFPDGTVREYPWLAETRRLGARSKRSRASATSFAEPLEYCRCRAVTHWIAPRARP
jgi:hypothetical protein